MSNLNAGYILDDMLAAELIERAISTDASKTSHDVHLVEAIIDVVNTGAQATGDAFCRSWRVYPQKETTYSPDTEKSSVNAVPLTTFDTPIMTFEKPKYRTYRLDDKTCSNDEWTTYVLLPTLATKSASENAPQDCYMFTSYNKDGLVTMAKTFPAKDFVITRVEGSDHPSTLSTLFPVDKEQRRLESALTLMSQPPGYSYNILDFGHATGEKTLGGGKLVGDIKLLDRISDKPMKLEDGSVSESSWNASWYIT